MLTPMAQTTRIERRSIDVVPVSERHGTPLNQLTLWFGANMQITAIVDGALAEGESVLAFTQFTASGS